MKIIVASDSHGYNQILYKIQDWHKDADLFLFCGDLEGDPMDYPGWIMVRGNNDYFGKFVNERLIQVPDHRILLTHSHRYPYFYREQALASQAIEQNCDIVCYGHTHVSHFENINGVLLLNPGSLSHSRDYNKSPSYAIMTFINGQIDIEFRYKEDWPEV